MKSLETFRHTTKCNNALYIFMITILYHQIQDFIISKSQLSIFSLIVNTYGSGNALIDYVSANVLNEYCPEDFYSGGDHI